MKNKNPYSILLDDETRIIMKTREIREKMIDGYIVDNNGVPTDSRGMRIMNEIMTSLDGQVLGLADARLKNEGNAANASLSESIKEIFTRVNSKNKNNAVTTLEETKLDDKFLPENVLDGETKIEYQELSLDDIMKK